MGILEGPNLGDIAQYSRNFRLRRQQFQGAYGASRHKRCTGVSGGSNGSADEWRARRTLKPLPLFLGGGQDGCQGALEDMKAKELKRPLKEKGLSTRGTKAQLIARLSGEL